jgi:hypothetical protein
MVVFRTLCALTLLLVSTSVAYADERVECATAHFDGQNLRDAAKLTKARERFLFCGNERCPRPIREECANFLVDLDRIQPTMVIDAIDEEGNATLDIRVFVDGEQIAERLTGRAMNIDPGEHELRIVSSGGRSKEQKVVMLEGDRAKRVSVRFDGTGAPKAATAATSDPPEPRHDRIPTAAWVLGGVGIVGLASGVTFGALALSDRSGFDGTCSAARTCNSSDVSSMHTKALVSDISFGVGAAAVVAAAILVLTRPHEGSRVQAAVTYLLGAPVEF